MSPTTHPTIPADQAPLIRQNNREPWVVWYAGCGVCYACWTREEAQRLANRYRAASNPSNAYGGSVDVYEWTGSEYEWRSTAQE